MPPLTSEQRALIVVRYRAGFSIYQIADEVGCAFQTVSKHLHKAGVEIRDRGEATRAGRARNPEAGRIYTSAQRREMVHLYETGLSAIQIAPQFGCSSTSILNYVREAGFPVRDPDRFTDDEKEAAIASYRSGRSAAAIARDLGCTIPCVTSWLKAAGSERRTQSEACRTVHFNEGAFDTIMTDAQAYWLGFLAADGGISDQGDVRINLQLRDREHLERFREFLALPTTVKTVAQTGGYSKTGGCYLDLRSRHLCAALARYGVGPRKTRTLRWPSALPSTLCGAYVRGLFDGDGTWCSMNRPGMCQWRLIGNRDFLISVQAIMIGHIDLSKTKLADHHTTSEIAYLTYGGSRQSLRIALWMYRDMTVCLPRKYTRYLEYLWKFHPIRARDFAALVPLISPHSPHDSL